MINYLHLLLLTINETSYLASHTSLFLSINKIIFTVPFSIFINFFRFMFYQPIDINAKVCILILEFCYISYCHWEINTLKSYIVLLFIQRFSMSCPFLNIICMSRCIHTIGEAFIICVLNV